MEGFGYKKRTNVVPHVYQRRYFRLDEGSHDLRYYKQPSDLKQRGSIELYDLRRIFPTAPADLGTSKLAKEYGVHSLSLQTEARTYHVMFDTAAEREYWLLAIWCAVNQSLVKLHPVLQPLVGAPSTLPFRPAPTADASWPGSGPPTPPPLAGMDYPAISTTSGMSASLTAPHRGLGVDASVVWKGGGGGDSGDDSGSLDGGRGSGSDAVLDVSVHPGQPWRAGQGPPEAVKPSVARGFASLLGLGATSGHATGDHDGVDDAYDWDGGVTDGDDRGAVVEGMELVAPGAGGMRPSPRRSGGGGAGAPPPSPRFGGARVFAVSASYDAGDGGWARSGGGGTDSWGESGRGRGRGPPPPPPPPPRRPSANSHGHGGGGGGGGFIRSYPSRGAMGLQAPLLSGQGSGRHGHVYHDDGEDSSDEEGSENEGSSEGESGDGDGDGVSKGKAWCCAVQ